ncbi:MAG: hypothetical protein RR842_14350, partial [Gordonibacter sp.]|uniref:hypothetical protein n=1 Tax=Gordonibacter sp. TaxID=1968902 RepID=UPI002FC86A0E
MEKVPLYLQWFFIRIRNHSDEEDYFVKRFENMSREKMLIETQMIGDLHKRGLILLSDKRENKVFNPLVFTDSNGAVF